LYGGKKRTGPQYAISITKTKSFKKMKIHSNISSNTKDAHPGKNLIEQKYLKVLFPSVILLYQLKKVVNRADT